jgi:ABC-type branched-subunit amino acid transport system ATPase component
MLEPLFRSAIICKRVKKMIEPLQHKQRQSAILLVEHALQFVATVVMMGGGGQ